MVFYRTYENTLITSKNLEEAFYIITGHKHFDYPKEFRKFRENCFGKSIKETVPSDIDFLCKEGYRILAMKLFSEQNDCNLLDAKKATDDFCKYHKYYPYDFNF
jgi:hypothetical protein